MNTLRKIKDHVGHHHDRSPDHEDAAAAGKQNGTSHSETSPGAQIVTMIPGLTDQVPFNARATPPDVQGVDDQRTSQERKWDKTKRVGHAFAHPVEAAKKKRARGLVEQISPEERPWLHDQTKGDAQLIATFDEVEEQQRQLEERNGKEEGKGKELEDIRVKAKRLEQQRSQLEVRWHMSRYVKRVRVVRGPLAWPQREAYKVRNAGGVVVVDRRWKWLGHVLYYGFQNAALPYVDPTNTAPYDREDLMRAMERLLVVSDSFQFWWMRVRKVYRWEDPWLTGRWLGLYLVLLKTNYFMSFFWAYLIYSVLRNRDGKVSRQWMRESTARAQRKDRAAMLSELIMQHGHEDWFEELLSQFGPWLQEQLLDLAQFLEISNSYYTWRNPASTWGSIIGYATLFLVSAIPDLKISMKIFWLSCGLWFFFSRPISSLYPRFRHVVDPVRWFFWHQPTMAEWSFQWLREQALESIDEAKHTNTALMENSDVDSADEEIYWDCISHTRPHNTSLPIEPSHRHQPAIKSFNAHWSGRRGRLEITRDTARFLTRGNLTDSVEWEKSLSFILEVRKLTLPLTSLPTPSITKLARSSAALVIVWVNNDDTMLSSPGEQTLAETSTDEDTMYAMHEDPRDEAFNLLIGVSGALWQELQGEPDYREQVRHRPKKSSGTKGHGKGGLSEMDY